MAPNHIWSASGNIVYHTVGRISVELIEKYFNSINFAEMYIPEIWNILSKSTLKVIAQKFLWCIFLKKWL